LFFVLIAAICGNFAFPVVNVKAAPIQQVISHLVISQVYGGGGNANALYVNDYVEIFNPTDLPISVNGWSIQYTAATGTSWQVTPLTNFSILAGQYYLVQLASGGSVGNPLPTPDATGSTNMSAAAGKARLR
jgi:predicted extracellular nuclease